MAMLSSLSLTVREPAVRAARGHETQRVLDTLTLAFAADPAVRWLFPSAQQYLCYFPAFAQAFGGGAIADGTAYLCEDDAGAALWLRPDAVSDEVALVALLEESLDERDKPVAFQVFEEMAGYHPEEPHWYLPLVGVDPTRHNEGYGSALMAHALRLCDETARPAYLESSNPRNIPLYRRFGFEVIGEIRVGTCPTITPMLRPARPARTW